MKKNSEKKTKPKGLTNVSEEYLRDLERLKNAVERYLYIVMPQAKAEAYEQLKEAYSVFQESEFKMGTGNVGVSKRKPSLTEYDNLPTQKR